MRLIVLALAAVSAFGQFASMNGMRWSQEGDLMKVTLGGPMTAWPAVTGAPYYAERISESVLTLADGTRISQASQNPQKVWRDSEGRQRMEQAFISRNGDFVLSEISDPVTGFAYVLDEREKVAHRYALGPAKPWTPPSASVRLAQPTAEVLGDKNIEGVIAEGTRFTTVIPVGQVGNDRQIVTTAESWYARDLQLMVLSLSSDPRYGDSVVRMKNISRAEPEASLFVPPAGYGVVDERESFTLFLGKR